MNIRQICTKFIFRENKYSKKKNAQKSWLISLFFFHGAQPVFSLVLTETEQANVFFLFFFLYFKNF